jgi:hypothetical protein
MINSPNKFTVTKRHCCTTVKLIIIKGAGEADVKKNNTGNGLIRVGRSGLGS